ncbi:MAG: N-acetyl-gamma-glutamyl-phosphate reductase [Gammaproteobacteria bacterium]
MISVGVVGGTGYTGVELLRLLASHPHVKLTTVTSRAERGKPIAGIFPSLRGRLSLTYTDPEIDRLSTCELVFFAAPNGTAMTMAPSLLDCGVRIIDLAADFRLRDPSQWEHWYGMPHACPELLQQAVYGLPEMSRDGISDARIVANPGCYPTAVLLGLLPLIKRGVVDTRRLVADTKSGLSGAGREPSTRNLFCETADSVTAYNVSGHRHSAEIIQELVAAGACEPDLVFVPHLTPMIRGILATLYCELTDLTKDLQGLYEQCYAGEPFVDVMPSGAHPETRGVRGSNVCRLAVHRSRSGRKAVVLSAIDNLVKGAAGQAVQNMNIMYGFDETVGLEHTALLP